MPKPFLSVRPYLLNSRTNLPQGNALRAASLAANLQYVNHDLCTVAADGTLQKAITTTPANVTKLCLAVGRYNLDPSGANPGYHRNAILDGYPEFYRRIDENDLVIFTLDAAVPWAETLRQVEKDLSYDSTDGVMKVRSTSGSPAVRILYPATQTEMLEAGYATPDVAVGDTNVPVVCTVLRAVRA